MCIVLNEHANYILFLAKSGVTNRGESLAIADSYSEVVCSLFGDFGIILNNSRLRSSPRHLTACQRLNNPIFLHNPSPHLLIIVTITSSYDNLEGNHLNCLKLDLITTNVMILTQMVFSLLNVYVNVCMHMSSAVQCLRSEHRNTMQVS